MMNSMRKGYLVAALAIASLALAALAFKTTSGPGGLSVCGCGACGASEHSAHQTSPTAAEQPPGRASLDTSNVNVACQLSETELGQRMKILRELKEGALSSRELDDGYELSYPGTQAWAGKLFDFVSAERQCCPFFLFELTFEPQAGPIRLSLRGGEEVKDFLDKFLPAL